MVNFLYFSLIELCSLFLEFDLFFVDVEKLKVFNIKKKSIKVKKSWNECKLKKMCNIEVNIM